MRTATLVLVDPPLYRDAPDEATAPPPHERPKSVVRKGLTALRQSIITRWQDLTEPRPDDVEEALSEPILGKPYARVTAGRAHLYVSGARKSFGIASFRMAVAPRALATKALISCVAIAVLMTAAASMPGSAVHDHGPTITTLLLVPGLLGFLAQPRENPLVSQYLGGVRLITILAAACPIVAAVSLIGTSHVGSIRILWIALALIDWLMVVLLIPSRLLPAPTPRP